MQEANISDQINSLKENFDFWSINWLMENSRSIQRRSTQDKKKMLTLYLESV